jgi:hypothetical protein
VVKTTVAITTNTTSCYVRERFKKKMGARWMRLRQMNTAAICNKRLKLTVDWSKVVCGIYKESGRMSYWERRTERGARRPCDRQVGADTCRCIDYLSHVSIKVATCFRFGLGRAIIQFFPWNLVPECLRIATPRLAGRRITAPHASVRVWRSSGTWHETHHVDKAMSSTRASSL